MSLKSLLAASAAAGALIAANPAQADNVYLSLFGGFSSPDVDVFAGPFSFLDSNGYSTKTSRTGVNNVVFTSDRYTNLPYDVKLLDGTFYRTLGSGTTWGTNAFGGGDELDSGFVVGAALGVDFQDGWRAEIEVAFRQYDLGGRQNITALQTLSYFQSARATFYGLVGYYTNFPIGFISSTTIAPSSKFSVQFSEGGSYSSLVTGVMNSDGEFSSFSLMANVWYGFDLGEGSPITPFVGIGAGFAKLDGEYRGSIAMPSHAIYYNWAGSYLTNTFSFNYDADDYVFAWQAGAGLAYEFANGMSLSAQYRYFATGDVNLGRRDVGVEAHEALFGLSFPLGR